MKQDESTPLDNFQVLPSLTHYLRPNYVQVIDQEMTWEEAVSLACQPLLDHQIIDSRFINDCVNQIKQPGYAGYLGMRTCIPHTTVDKGSLMTVSALWFVKTGDFSEWGGHQFDFAIILL